MKTHPFLFIPKWGIILWTCCMLSNFVNNIASSKNRNSHGWFHYAKCPQLCEFDFNRAKCVIFSLILNIVGRPNVHWCFTNSNVLFSFCVDTQCCYGNRPNCKRWPLQAHLFLIPHVWCPECTLRAAIGLIGYLAWGRRHKQACVEWVRTADDGDWNYYVLVELGYGRQRPKQIESITGKLPSFIYCLTGIYAIRILMFFSKLSWMSSFSEDKIWSPFNTESMIKMLCSWTNVMLIL